MISQPDKLEPPSVDPEGFPKVNLHLQIQPRHAHCLSRSLVRPISDRLPPISRISSDVGPLPKLESQHESLLPERGPGCLTHQGIPPNTSAVVQLHRLEDASPTRWMF